VVTLVHSSRGGVLRPCAWPAGTSRWLAAAGGPAAGAGAPEWPADAADLLAAIEATPGTVRAALARFDFRAATAAVWAIVEAANRYVDATQPWHLARAERAGDPGAGARLDAVLGALLAACQVVAAEIWPFLPDLAARVAAACNDSAGALPEPRPVFPRIQTRQYPASAA
jgi:methionyl-tRNA synthetase